MLDTQWYRLERNPHVSFGGNLLLGYHHYMEVRFREPVGLSRTADAGANRPESRLRRKLSSPPTAVVDEFRTSQRLGSMRFLLLDAFSST